MNPKIPPYAAHLLKYLGKIEAGGYDVIFGNAQKKLPKPITKMTLGEVIAVQGTYKRLGIKSTATGMYQFMRATLQGMVTEFDLDTNTKFTPDFQDWLAFLLLKRRGYDKFVAGRMGLNTFATNLAKEWASMPVLKRMKGAHQTVERGQSYYAGDALNKSLVKADEFEAVLRVKLPGTLDEAEATPSGDGAPSVAPSPRPATTVALPGEAVRPSLWRTLWGALIGRDAKAKTIERQRPGLHLNGDPVLYDQQEMLSDKGWTEVGQPDGLPGTRTTNAVRAFRKDHGMAGSAIDEKFSAALLKSEPRQISVVRAEVTAKDLRENGSSQISILDGFGWVGKLLLGGGLLGGVEKSGVLDGVTDTLQTAQDTLGTIASVFTTIASVLTWCFSHWWIFAICGGLYVLFRVATGVMKFVLLVKQGFMTRTDK